MKEGTTNKPAFPEQLWAGTEHSLQLAMDAHARSIQAGFMRTSKDEDEEDLPYMLSLQGNVGVVSIRGPLVNRDSEYNRYYGVSSYADIGRALVAAAEHPDVQGILLDIDSGGGAVSGVADTATLIATINAQVKPVAAFTGGMMASAAYWLGSSAGHISASNTAIVGSIGVISTHMEVSKMLKEMGVGVTVMRAGQYKALANSFEPLTETAQRQVQDQLNAAYQVFIGHVAEARGTTVNLADQKMGQGREFFGGQALEAGLVDSIQSFDQAFSKFSSKLLDNTKVTQNNYGNHSMGQTMHRKALTEQQIAAAASGAVSAAVDTNAPAATTEAPGTAPTATPTETVVEAATETVEDKPAAQSNSELVGFLQSQLAVSQAEVVDLKVKAGKAEGELSALKAQVGPLVEIAARSLSNMRVALGYSSVDASKMAVDSLLAEHASTSEAFAKAFKSGGVAAVKAPDATTSAPLVNESLHKARVASTRVSN